MINWTISLNIFVYLPRIPSLDKPWSATMDLSFIKINGKKFIRTPYSLTSFDKIISIVSEYSSNSPFIYIDYILKGNKSTITLECMEKNCPKMIDIFIAEYKKTFKKKSMINWLIELLVWIFLYICQEFLL